MKSAFLIDAKNKEVTTVTTDGAWTPEAINERINTADGDVSEGKSIGEHGDKVFVDDFLNETTPGEKCADVGFTLYGAHYYGNALVTGSDASPHLTVEGLTSELEFDS